MLTEVIAYGAGAREAAIDDQALLTKLGAARQRLAAPFAAERVDLVAGVADTLLGERRAAASGPAAHFAFWTRKGGARQARRELRRARARTRNCAAAWPCLSSAAAECRDRLSLFLGALLSGRKRQCRAAPARDQRPDAGDRRSLSRTPASLGGRQPAVRPLSVSGRSWGEDFRARAMRASSGAATPRLRCSRPCPCATGESRSGSATGSRSRPSRARLSTSWTTPRLTRSPRSCTTTFSSSTRWPARRRTRFMSSAKRRLIRRRSGASSTPPRSNGRWTIPPAGSATRSAR